MRFDTIFSSEYRNTPRTVTDSDIISFMVGQGMVGTPSSIMFDGEIHRFSTDSSKRNDDAGWYVAVQFPSGAKAVNFGDFRTQLHGDFISGKGKVLTEDERLEIEYEIEQARRKAREERDRYHDAKAKEAESFWNSLPAATSKHGYLTRKKVLPHGARLSPDGRLTIPLFNERGDLRSLQFIPVSKDEKKRFYTGCETKGCFWWLGDPDSQKVFLCEGFATAASVNEVSGCTTFIAFSASALATTARILRDQGKTVTVIADNDDAGRLGAGKCEGCDVITIPIEGMDANDYQNGTGELKDILPDLSVRSMMLLVDDILKEDLKVSWLIKGWIPSGSIGMIHGPSASGKTTIMLDMLLSASSGLTDWQGNRIRRPIGVVYLCGEGLVGVKRRIRAWSSSHGITDLGHFAVYPLPLDLDTAAGVHTIREQIRTLGWNPDIIVIDTVNRYMSGDENSAQDTRVLLNCVDTLRSECSCSGLYVHHTGNSEETQKRARGSSAWRGALDYEISVNVDDTGTRVIEQVKMKDTELMQPMYGVINGEEIPGVTDEDGEPVTGAVFSVCDAPQSEVDRRTGEAMNMLLTAYAESGKSDNRITYGYLKNWIVENQQVTKKTAEKMLNPNESNRFIGKLVNAGAIVKEGDGFYIRPCLETGLINEMNGKKQLNSSLNGDNGDKMETSRDVSTGSRYD